jgi:signal transduction histidine kinase
MLAFTKLSLARQFALVSFLFLMIGMVIMGSWMGLQIEQAVTNRTAAITALYVDSYISIYLQELVQGDQISQANLDALERLLSPSLLGQQVVSFRIWSRDGVILYSPNPDLIGRQYPVKEELQRALAGEVQSHLSDLDDPEQVYERQFWDQLIETYAPVRAIGSGEIIAVTEFYQTPSALQADIRAAQYRSWFLVAGATLLLYVSLAGMVGRASHLITAQHARLQESLDQTRALLAQNEDLNDRVRRAAARTTTLNERYLRRISADLHDGPAQDLALAMLRLESLAEAGLTSPAENEQDFQTVRTAVESALKELRTISAGLRMPEINAISLPDTVNRAIRDYEQRFATPVEVNLFHLPQHASAPVKITLYRVLKEALTNGFRHAAGAKQVVSVGRQDDNLLIEVSDDGAGFDPAQVAGNGTHLGLIGMRERVEVLGGRFDVLSQPGGGTTIRATLPLAIPEVDDV